MAHVAILRETRGRVVGIVCAVPFRLVAGNARRRQADKHIALVTRVARHTHVRAGKSESGLGAVIENSARPGGGHGVAQRAVLREARSPMVWIGGAVPVCLVARDTGRGCSCEHIVLMA